MTKGFEPNNVPARCVSCGTISDPRPLGQTPAGWRRSGDQHYVCGDDCHKDLKSLRRICAEALDENQRERIARGEATMERVVETQPPWAKAALRGALDEEHPPLRLVMALQAGDVEDTVAWLRDHAHEYIPQRTVLVEELHHHKEIR